jgi:hypothetical protein
MLNPAGRERERVLKSGRGVSAGRMERVVGTKRGCKRKDLEGYEGSTQSCWGGDVLEGVVLYMQWSTSGVEDGVISASRTHLGIRYRTPC